MILRNERVRNTLFHMNIMDFSVLHIGVAWMNLKKQMQL
jgi:hypothetical protein